jgi:hypothetical protein
MRRLLALALFLHFSDAAACPSSIENSTDYSVEGIKFVNVSTIDDCCAECASEANCRAFSYCTTWPCFAGGGKHKLNCHLKGATPGPGDKIASPGMASAAMPPTPAPKPTNPVNIVLFFGDDWVRRLQVQ